MDKQVDNKKTINEIEITIQKFQNIEINSTIIENNVITVNNYPLHKDLGL